MVGHDIGTVATLDLSKRDGRWPQLIMHGQRRERMAQRTDDLGHGGDGIRALPGLARVRRDAGHLDLKPRAALVRHLDLPVGGLGVQHPFARADPAGIDGRLGAAHKVLLVDRANEREAAVGQLAPCRYSLECVDKRGNGAGQAALHVAGAAANLHGIERRTIKLRQLLLNEPLNEVFNLALICAGVRAVNLHKVLRKPPGKVLINHMQPHNQSAFQTDCKPPKKSATCAQQYLPFAGLASAFAVQAGLQTTQWVRTLHGRHAVRHICLSVSPDTPTGFGDNAGPARFCGRSAQGASL